ncbi:MAG: transcriptional repressor [Alphaproteobacteria bacterium]|nr:transcriptional repressor [Alphaproteobacteria bacterium]
MKAATPLARDHDHAHCVSDALARAETVCAQRGGRLTDNRRRVLELVWRSHAPVGAYEILEALRKYGAAAAPPTVYRALDFLMEQGLVHRIESRNAFAGCPQPEQHHVAQYLLCEGCGDAVEIEVGGLARRIANRAAEIGFIVAAQTVEARGLCRRCQQTAPA